MMHQRQSPDAQNSERMDFYFSVRGMQQNKVPAINVSPEKRKTFAKLFARVCACQSVTIFLWRTFGCDATLWMQNSQQLRPVCSKQTHRMEITFEAGTQSLRWWLSPQNSSQIKCTNVDRSALQKHLSGKKRNGNQAPCDLFFVTQHQKPFSTSSQQKYFAAQFQADTCIFVEWCTHAQLNWNHRKQERNRIYPKPYPCLHHRETLTKPLSLCIQPCWVFFSLPSTRG